METLAAIALTQLALVAAVFWLGGLVKGAVGFGLPLTTMAIMPYFLPVETALVVNALVIPFANIGQFVQQRVMLDTLRRFRWLLAGLCLGVPAGALFVSLVDEAVLLAALGVFVLGFSLLSMASPRLRLSGRGEPGLGAGVGLLAGVIGALSTANGPLLVLYLVARGIERRLFISALGLFFLLTGTLLSGSFMALGMVDAGRLMLAAAALAGTFAGMMLGNRLAGRLPAAQFRLAILVVLCLLGANLALRGFSGL